MSASPDGVVTCPSCGARNRVPVVAGGKLRCARCHVDLPWLTEVTASQFDAVVERSSMPVLVDLWAPWCGPCHMIAPALEQLAVDRAGSLRIAKVNVDEQPEVSSRLGVMGIPTLVLFDKGAEVSRQVGALPAHQLERWVDSSVGAA